MVNFRRIAMGAVLSLIVTAGAFASNFRAADLVYLPAAARTAGNGGAFFKTDVYISNLSDQRVNVSIAFSKGAAGDANAVANAVTIATLNPFERRNIVDIVKTVFNLDQGVGQMLFFACREGGNCQDCDSNPADCKLITVEGRIYTQTTGAGCPNGAANCSFGQLFSGIPWYNFVSSTAGVFGLSEVNISGIQQNTAFRSNIGVTNASNEYITTIRIRLFTNSGTLVGSVNVDLGSLGFAQSNVSTLFPGFTGEGYVLVDQLSSTLINPAEANPGTPGFFAYGSLLDNVSNDPTTLEAQYEKELPFACVYPGKPPVRPVKHR